MKLLEASVEPAVHEGLQAKTLVAAVPVFEAAARG